MKTSLIEVFGWFGAAAIILAYILVSFSILPPTSFYYQLLNASGALGIVTISFYKKVYQPGALNIVWTMIALVAIIKILL